ncbi:hypothetical protein Daus18300_009635 [Diaporthe australafricana]|uniref:FAD/NAD(P)-binding domain-containing protein n=1 Tax=Diaporthe australafricana TaxID=127596 RepID=A0ABR3WDE9_9PEZI
MAMSRKNILILGGSYGGLSSAHYILKHVIPQLPDREVFQVILISPSSQVFCRPACPRAMLSDHMFPQDKLFVDIEAQFLQYSNGANFQFIQGTAAHLDLIQRIITAKVESTNSTLGISFHSLVIATGASTPSPLLGLITDENLLRDCWSSLRKRLPEVKNIIISGGGPTSIEVAGELGEFLNGRPGIFNSSPSSPRVNITVITSNSKILPSLRQAIADKAEKLLAGVGVTVIKNARVKTIVPAGAGVDPQLLTSKATIVLENGKVMDTDLYIPATGTTPNTGFISDKSLLTSDGRIDTNPSTLRVDGAGPNARIYAIGDASSYARPAIHNILSAVPVLCASVRDDLVSEGGRLESLAVGGGRLFVEDKRETQLVPIGRSRGVGAAMRFQIPGFLVWMLKWRDYWLWTTGSLWNGKKWDKES